MTHANRGTKRHCGACGAPFYDLNRDPIVCPKCAAPYVVQIKVPLRSSRTPRHVAPEVAVVEEEIKVFQEDDIPEHDHDDEDDPLVAEEAEQEDERE